ncbi:MAG: inositol monophosphatase [Candidatus Moranbacteria bacterium]|nr:inositol monophosphatase [Candidatus Moranbacteria bacterium]
MEQIITVATDAAKEAGAILKELFADRMKRYEMKNAHDIVAEADLKSEAIILGRIKDAFPDHAILSEEAGENGKESEYKWIVDPLDGTINFSRGITEFCVSIAVSRYDELVFGLVYEPVSGRLFVAEKEKGAMVNGAIIRVSDERNLVNTLLATDNTSDIPNRIRNFRLLEKVCANVRHVRIFGSSALHLARIASGEIDVYYKIDCNYWDNAAGILILREAGGMVTDMSGADISPKSDTIVATNGWVHEELMELLNLAD